MFWRGIMVVLACVGLAGCGSGPRTAVTRVAETESVERARLAQLQIATYCARPGGGGAGAAQGATEALIQAEHQEPAGHVNGQTIRGLLETDGRLFAGSCVSPLLASWAHEALRSRDARP